MKKAFILFFLFLLTITAFLIIMNPAPVLADANSQFWANQQNQIQTNTGLGGADPRIMAANVVKIVLGFLGIIALVIILLGGFRWMTAGGNEDHINEAKRIIITGIVGILIILASYGLAQFVIQALYNATGATG